MNHARHLSLDELETRWNESRPSPKNKGVLELIVRRPQTEKREVLEEGELDLAEGLVGDNWRTRGSLSRSDGTAHPDKQLTIMNSRVIALVAGDKD